MSTPPPLPRWAQPRETGGMPAPDSPLDRQFAAFVGPRWATYRRKFAPYFQDPRFQPTWNWAAALVTPFGPFWFLYRKLYVPAVLFWLLPTLALNVLWDGGPVTLTEVMSNAPNAQALRGVVLGVQLSMVVLAGGTANFLLFRRARAAIHLATLRGASGEEAAPLLRKVGGVSPRAVAVMVAFLLLSLSVLRAGVAGSS